jgi:trehalose-phosphatase
MLDIDGTLCEIVQQPDAAVVGPAMRATISRLAGRTDGDIAVAFVTGRSVAMAQQMLGVDGVTIYGNHGIERLGRDGNIRTATGSDDAMAGLRSAAPEFAAIVTDFPGTFLEDKQFSLSVHYRGIDAARETELIARVQETASRHAVRLSGGKCVINITPAASWTKGDAALEIVRDNVDPDADASILYVGDDVTDEDAFRALGAVPGAVAVRVGDPTAKSAARISLDSPAQVQELLAILADRDS